MATITPELEPTADPVRLHAQKLLVTHYEDLWLAHHTIGADPMDLIQSTEYVLQEVSDESLILMAQEAARNVGHLSTSSEPIRDWVAVTLETFGELRNRLLLARNNGGPF